MFKFGSNDLKKPIIIKEKLREKNKYIVNIDKLIISNQRGESNFDNINICTSKTMRKFLDNILIGKLNELGFIEKKVEVWPQPF